MRIKLRMKLKGSWYYNIQLEFKKQTKKNTQI